MADNQKERIMRYLGVTAEEADEIIATDKAIDRGERVAFDLSKEDEKAAKKWANTGTRKTPPAYKFTKRERKENTTKSGIIAELADFLNELEICANVEITNKERMIAFDCGDNKYELTLIQKRKPK